MLYRRFTESAQKVDALGDKSQELAARKEEQTLRMKRLSIWDTSSTERQLRDALEDDLEHSKTELVLCQEREQMLQMEINELQRQRNEVRLNKYSY